MMCDCEGLINDESCPRERDLTYGYKRRIVNLEGVAYVANFHSFIVLPNSIPALPVTGSRNG